MTALRSVAVLALALGLAACESPDSQTYDPVLDEKIGDPDHPDLPDKPDGAVRYVCAEGDTFFLARSADRNAATVRVGEDDREVLLLRDDDGVYRDEAGRATVRLDGDLAFLDLGERAYRDCEPQAE